MGQRLARHRVVNVVGGGGSVGRVRVQFQKVRKKYNSTIVQKVRKKYKKYTKSTSGFVAGFVQLVYQCGGKKKRFGGSVGSTENAQCTEL